MSSIFLDRDELQQLTGYKRQADQIRWLQTRGVPHFVNSLGRPVVSRDFLWVQSVVRFKLGEVR